MNKWWCFILLSWGLFSCNGATSQQESNKEETTLISSISKATQKRISPNNDKEKAELKGKVKSVLSLSETGDSSIVMFDALGRLIKEGNFFGSKGFSGHTYEFDSLGNPLKLYDGGRVYDPEDDFSTYFSDTILNTYDAKGQLIAYQTVDTGRNGYKYILEYSDKGQLLREISQSIDGKEVFTIVKYAYDNNGFLAKKATQRAHQDYIREMKVYENDAFGNVVKETFYTPNRKVAVKKYTMDAAANPIQMIYTVREATNVEVDEVYYQKIATKESKNLDELLGKPKTVIRKTMQIFDDKSQCTSLIEYENGVMIEKMHYTYDQQGNCVEIESGLTPADKYVVHYQYEYDANGNWLKKWHKDGEELILETSRIIEYYD